MSQSDRDRINAICRTLPGVVVSDPWGDDLRRHLTESYRRVRASLTKKARRELPPFD
ncbi:MAG: hypothetical protein OEU92_12490 [Alphaproteobacteria bacterium]|nr:hypothetical protein [Alphaproteobacteria bacterium]